MNTPAIDANEIPFYNPKGENTSDYAVFKRVPWGDGDKYPMQINPAVGDEIRQVVLDVETTGLLPNGVVIEIALADIRYSPSTHQITSIQAVEKMYQDPGFSIPPEITKITGIRDEDVKGKSLDLFSLHKWFSGDPIIIAHNAAFDRPMTETALKSHIPALASLRWSCSMSDIAWKDMGFESRGQRQLVFEHGGFYKAHEALSDVLALVWLLNENAEARKQLADKMSRPFFLIKAVGAPFSVKDELKAGGFQWGDEKVWSFGSVNGDDLKDAVRLIDASYGGARSMRIEMLDARSKYTSKGGERVTFDQMLDSIAANEPKKQAISTERTPTEQLVFGVFGL